MSVDPTHRAPLVSVVIPAYNAASTLDEQLVALLDQHADFPWEILVCDNGSTDATADVVRRRQQDRGAGSTVTLRLIDASARRGPSAARNIGAREARAALLAFCDADDVVARDWLATLVDALASTPLVGGYAEFERLRPPSGMAVNWRGTGPLLIDVPGLPGFIGMASCNLGVRREVFIELGGFDEALFAGEDADFSCRAQLAGHAVALCGAVCHYRLRGTFMGIARQAWGWGACAPTLTRRYALVREAIAALPAASTSGTAVAEPEAHSPARSGRPRLAARQVVHLASTAARRILGRRMRSGLADFAMKTGMRLGARFGRVDTSVAQIEPPHDLAAIVERAAQQRWREPGVVSPA